jgi:hypothetical protein
MSAVNGRSVTNESVSHSKDVHEAFRSKGPHRLTSAVPKRMVIVELSLLNSFSAPLELPRSPEITSPNHNFGFRVRLTRVFSGSLKGIEES